MDETATETEAGFKPPYMSFQTFWGFIGELGSKPLPPQIDRSLMESKSGSDQANLTAALKTFGLIGDDLSVQSSLIGLTAASDDERPALLGALVRANYVEPLRVSEENGTEKQLGETFRTIYKMETADTRRKAITFFLHAARTSKIALSPHFPATRSGSGAGGTTRGKKPRRKPPGGENGDRSSATSRPPAGEEKVIDFGDAGKVTIFVAVKWLDLPNEKFTKLRQLVDQFDQLGLAVNTEEDEL